MSRQPAIERHWDDMLRDTEAPNEFQGLLHSTQGNNDESDARLAAVVELAVAGDPMAVALVLRRLLPGLISVARRRAHAGYGRIDEILTELTAVAYIVIREYPIERRPRRVASNLVRDCEYELFVRDSRRKSVANEQTQEWMPDRPVAASGNASAELINLMNEVRTAEATQDIELLTRLTVEGQSVNDVAADLKCTTRTVLNRRLAAEVRLRELVLA